MSEFIFKRHLDLDIIKNCLHFYKILTVRLRNLIDWSLSFKVNTLVILDGFVHYCCDVIVLVIEIVLIV